MRMRDYLRDTFLYNDSANKKLVSKVAMLPDSKESIKLISHLVNCQYKWMARIKQDNNAQNISWWEPVYILEELADELTKSLQPWLDYLANTSDKTLAIEVNFIGYDSGIWAAAPQDIALQLNYHSIHHRAQIQKLIRQQGFEPDFLDYIGTKYRKLS